MAVSVNGELASTVSDDKVVKVFDVVNFGNYFIISFLFCVIIVTECCASYIYKIYKYVIKYKIISCFVTYL